MGAVAEQPGSPPEQPGKLQNVEAGVRDLQAAALRSQDQVAAARGATDAAGAEAVLVAAYTRRLQRLARLLQRYDARLGQALAALGLQGQQEQQEEGGGTDAAAAPARAASALAQGLAQAEGDVLAALSAADAAPEPQALLQLGSDCAQLAAQAAAAGRAAILAELQAGVEADLRAVNAWPEVGPAGTGAAAPAAAAPFSPAFGQLQQEQKERWEAQAARQQRLEQLRAEVAAAREALGGGGEPGDGGAAAGRTLLAAQQAGLRAELECLHREQRQAEAATASAQQRAAQVAEQRAAVAALERREAALDAAVQALCRADGQAMRQWRQGTWRAQEAVDSGVLSQRAPLMAISQQLLEAQRNELAAFRRSAGGGQAAVGASSAAAAQPAAQPASACSNASAAALLLDPLAGLKTGEHAAALLAGACSELAELQPVQREWAELAAGSGAKLAALQQAAAELSQRVAGLQDEGGSAALQQLRDAAAAAEEGSALVTRARQALAEWWTMPAVTATPWLKREGKTAEEWLRLLCDQQRAARQREALTDSNRRRAAAVS